MEEEENKHQQHAFVYRICPAEEWKDAQSASALTGGQLDLSSGFIHLSTSFQVRTYYFTITPPSPPPPPPLLLLLLLLLLHLLRILWILIVFLYLCEINPNAWKAIFPVLQQSPYRLSHESEHSKCWWRSTTLPK